MYQNLIFLSLFKKTFFGIWYWFNIFFDTGILRLLFFLKLFVCMVGDKLNIFLSRFEDKNLECERGCDQFDDALSLRTHGRAHSPNDMSRNKVSFSRN